MNPRIKELAKQAGINIPDDTEYNGHIHRNAIEKLAQLIVGECAKFMTTVKIEAMPPDDKAIKVLVDVLVEDMKHYFGVEE